MFTRQKVPVGGGGAPSAPDRPRKSRRFIMHLIFAPRILRFFNELILVQNS